MTNEWSFYVILLTLANIVACWWLLHWTSKPDEDEQETTGHVWDDDLTEYNNPLPLWWLSLFYITVAFAIGYLIVYPGLGNLAGSFDWSQTKQYEDEVTRANHRYGKIFKQYAQQSVSELIDNTQALKSGQRLFINYCAACHGSDARGAPGFPDLADNDWLYGGTPESIKTSIAEGRSGMMPPWREALGETGIKEVANYVLSLSGRDHSEELASQGKEKFISYCAGCHNMDGTGNQILGAPNLSDDIWLYGGSLAKVEAVIANGINGDMPAHKDLLSPEKIHVLTAYIYSLSQTGKN